MSQPVLARRRGLWTLAAVLSAAPLPAQRSPAPNAPPPDVGGEPASSNAQISIDVAATDGADSVAADAGAAADVARNAVVDAPPPAAEFGPPPEITIQGAPLSRVPGAAHVIRGRVMERAEYDDPHALLLAVPGVYARGEDGYGLRPNLGIRGALSDRSKKITLMEDGVLFAPAPYSAPAAYYFPLMTRMSQVRVIKGFAAVGHGPHTIAGAVDLITRSIPAEPSGRLDAAIGQHGYGKFHGFAGTSSERLGLLLEGVHVRSDGFKHLPGGEDTGFYRNEWMVKGSYNVAPHSPMPHEIGVKLSYSDELSNETYLGLTDADFAQDALQRYATSKLDQMRWHRTALAVTHRIVPVAGLEITTTAYRNDLSRSWRKLNRFLGRDVADVLANPGGPDNALYYAVLTGRADSAAPGETLMIGPNQREFVAHGLELRSRWDTRSGALAHRLEYGLRVHYDRVERRHSEDGYQAIGGDLIPTGGATLVTAENEAATEAVALHAAYTVGYRALTLSPGVRGELLRSVFIDRRTRAETRSAVQVVLPGIGGHYALTRSFGLLAGVYRGFSPPPPEPRELGAAEPRPELAVNTEAGARFAEGEARAELIGFYNAYSNLTNICTFSSGCTDDSIDRQSSAGRARIYGLEAYVAHELRAGSLTLPFSLAYTLTVTEFLERFSSTDPIFGEVERGDEMPYVPRHQAQASIGLEGGRAKSYLTATYVARMREQAGSEPLDESVATDEQLTFDAGAKYEVRAGLELYVNVRNVLDARDIVSRRPYGARPNAPRLAQLGAKLEF